MEVYFRGVWGTVCHDSWNAPDAMVVCRQLGLPYANAQPFGGSAFGQGSGQVWLTQVSCGGLESALDECLHYNYAWGRNGCQHSQDAGVLCTNGNDINHI